jgi:hypothetical protein
MTTSTIERAYQLARAGKAADVPALKLKLKADGCRAVDTLLSPRGIQRHLEAICAANFKPPQAGAPPKDESAK